MVIKAQSGQLHAAEQFLTYIAEESYGITHKLMGLTRNNTKIELLKYTSFEDRNFIQVAMRRLENGISNGQRLVDLTGICELDYTPAELGIK